jgi:hypothetical protein
MPEESVDDCLFGLLQLATVLILSALRGIPESRWCRPRQGAEGTENFVGLAGRGETILRLRGLGLQLALGWRNQWCHSHPGIKVA